MAKSASSYQKLRGGYYTPRPIGEFLANWAIQSAGVNVLEPSCGDGELLACAFERLTSCGDKPIEALNHIYGIEIEEEEATKALTRFQSIGSAKIFNGDFFAYGNEYIANQQLFDAVIGNPPFIRYQNFPEQSREVAFRLMREVGLHPNRLTNSWLPFLVISTLLLKAHGRLAMVIPAELLQVNYAAELRQFLSQFYKRITLITFRKLVFQDIQQEVILLLGERDGIQDSGIRTIELANAAELAQYSDSWTTTDTKQMDHDTEKWTMYFLDRDELALIRELKAHPGFVKASKVIDVDVGIVTGANDYFVVNEDQVNDHQLADFTWRLVGRSNYLQGLIFSEEDWREIANKALGAYLLDIPKATFEPLPQTLRHYIAFGEGQQIHRGFKCRNRTPWYSVPSIWTSPAFLLRQIHSYPKIVLNAAGATCTDTIHRVRFRTDVPPTIIAASFLNSVTFAFSEITGRSYGGGVLELEPNEAEQLLIPLISEAFTDPIEIDKLLRAGKIETVLDITDEILLKGKLGLSEMEVQRLRRIWGKLRDRRINRKHEAKLKL